MTLPLVFSSLLADNIPPSDVFDRTIWVFTKTNILLPNKLVFYMGIRYTKFIH